MLNKAFIITTSIQTYELLIVLYNVVLWPINNGLNKIVSSAVWVGRNAMNVYSGIVFTSFPNVDISVRYRPNTSDVIIYD